MATMVICHNCSRQLRVPEELLGKLVKCPSCQAAFTASSAQAPEAAGAAPQPAWTPDRPAPEWPTSSGPAPARPAPKNLEPHRAILILVLGIISIKLAVLLFGVIGLALGIPAWSMGQADLRKMDNGEMDPGGRGMTKAGMICGIVGTTIGGVFALVILMFVLFFVAMIFIAAMAGPSR